MLTLQPWCTNLTSPQEFQSSHRWQSMQVLPTKLYRPYPDPRYHPPWCLILNICNPTHLCFVYCFPWYYCHQSGQNLKAFCFYNDLEWYQWLYHLLEARCLAAHFSYIGYDCLSIESLLPMYSFKSDYYLYFHYLSFFQLFFSQLVNLARQSFGIYLSFLVAHFSLLLCRRRVDDLR